MIKILIVDDDKDVCDMMSFTFASRGFDVLIAYDAEQAFDMVKSENPDMVVSDVRMPKGGGLKLLRDIKKWNAGRPKVILISGFIENATEEALAAGAEAVLSKPVKLQMLIDRVVSVLTETDSSPAK